MDAAFTQRGSEFRSKNPEKLTFGLNGAARGVQRNAGLYWM